MTNFVRADFDRHPHVRYRDADRLYWGVFAYRVTLPLHMIDDIKYPDDDSEFTSTTTKHCIHFYFVGACAAESFIEANLPKITVVYRPRTEDEIGLMRSSNRNIRHIVRDRLFWDRFEWRIIFSHCADTDQLDQWVEEMFPEGSDAFYSYNDTRRNLYLNDHYDLLTAKIAHTDIIKQIEKAVIREA